MPYEVKTPMLNEAADMAREAYKRVISGRVDPREATVINNSAGMLVKVVATDSVVRLRAPKIAAYEAEVAAAAA
jgi:hypothetical protein